MKMNESISTLRKSAVAVVALLALLAVVAGLWGGDFRAPAAEAQSNPGNPVNVSVVRGHGYLDVSWTAPSSGGAPTGYHVVASDDYKKSWWRAATGVNPTPVNGRLTYRVTGDVNNTVSIFNHVTYYVSVSAVNGSGGSSWRDAGPIAPFNPPGRPASASATRGDGYLDVSWPRPSYGSVPTGYDVVVKDYTTNNWWRAATEVNPTPVNNIMTYRVTGDVDGNVSISDAEAYQVAVRAVNDIGASAWRNSGPLPGQPTLSVGNEGAATWSYILAPGVVVRSYELRWTKTSDSDWSDVSSHTANADVSEYQIPKKDLDLDRQYQAKLIAKLSVNGAEQTTESDLVTFRTPTASAAPLGKPTFSVTETGATTWTYSPPGWATLTNSDEVRWQEDPNSEGNDTWSGHQSQTINSAQSASFQIPSLDEKKTYKTKVRVGVSLGGLTRYAESDVLVFTVPLELGKPTLSVSNSGAAAWSYSVPTGATFSSYELNWIITFGRADDDWTGYKKENWTSSDTTTFQIPKLQPGREHKAKLIVGLDVDGVAKYTESDTVVFTPPSLTPPTLAVSSAGVATWSYTPASGTVQWNEIWYKTADQDWSDALAPWGISSPYQLTDLEPSTQYDAKLIVVVKPDDGSPYKFATSAPVTFETGTSGGD